MNEAAHFPEAAASFLDFPRFLRDHGFPVAADQIMAFMAAVPLLGPRSMRSVHYAAHATLAPMPDRRAEFDELFHRFFYADGTSVAAARSLPERDAPAREAPGGPPATLEARRANESGEVASRAEALASRKLAGDFEIDPFLRLRREAERRLPRRRRLRHRRMAHGPVIDLRRSLSGLVPHDGDIVDLRRMGRPTVPRRVVLLIDISGSMKAASDRHLAFAHELTQIRGDTETFLFGTRLTRVTGALRQRNRSQALGAASALVADWDGGTRIGEALATFLGHSRFAGLAAGAIVLLITDGLERGDHALMVDMVRRLARKARHLSFLSPLAGDPRFRPATAGLRALLPVIGKVADGSSLDRLVDHLLSVAPARGVK